MDKQRLSGAVKTLLLRTQSTSTQKALELLRGLPGRGGFVPKLTRWFEENRSAFPEPFTAEDLDSLFDPGVDVLLTGLRSGVRIGFQVKSDKDLASSDFTSKLKAQIQDARRVGVELYIVVFACAPTPQNLPKIKFWQNYSLVLSTPEILCIPPERAAGLYENFDSPIEPIVFAERSWADFFQAVGRPNLASFYLDPWPLLPPDQRFLPPEAFTSICQAVETNRLTFLVGSPATGKTFTALRLLWDAFQEGRRVHWLTTTDADLTEGPIPRTELGLAERTELRRRVDGLWRMLGSPQDQIDVVSKFAPGSLIYIEDPFGKSEEEYGLSMASYDFFDIQRFVEELGRSSARASCRILVTSREPLFQRWLADLRAKGREAPHPVILLGRDDYDPAPLFDHAVLLARANGLTDPEAIAEVLADRVESPFELDTLIRSLPPHAGVAEAEEIVRDWEGELRTKIEGRITPKDDRDAIVLLLIAASSFRHESLRRPSEMYSKLHSALNLEGEPQPTLDAILKRLSPFLSSQGEAGTKARLFVPTHTVVREAMREQLAASERRPLLCRLARTLPEIPPKPRPPKSQKGFSLEYLVNPWADHYLLALYLLSLGVALEGPEEAEALENLLFDLVGIERLEYRKVMESWHLLPDRFHQRLFAVLRQAPQKDPWALREAAASLPHTTMAPSEAWKVLELLLEEPERGSEETMYLQFPWAYLFLHLEEVPQGLQEKLDHWAREDPAFFVYAMLDGLLRHWERVPDLWHGAVSHPSCHMRPRVRDRLVRLTARYWGRASQPFRELFDFLARSPEVSSRALVGAHSLLYSDLHSDLEQYALGASRDPNPTVRLKTFAYGTGDEPHRRVAEALLDGAMSGFAAEVMLKLLEENSRDEIVPWEREILARCEHLGGDAAKAAIASAIFDGKKRAHELGYKLAESPFEEPEIVRAVWLRSHLDSERSKPPLSDDDLRRLLQSLTDPRIRRWCLAYTSYRRRSLPEELQQFLAELGKFSREDAAAIRAGATISHTKQTFSFSIRRLVDA